MKTDEELGRIAFRAHSSGFWGEYDSHDKCGRKKWNDLARAVREAVQADWKEEREAAAIRLDATQHALEISEAQREELREKLAAANREVAEHRKHVSIIMSRLQAAKKTATRPVSVHFDCTAEEAWKVYSEHNGERFDSMTEAMNYLARRAVVEVPEGVPSALELTHEWLRGGAYGVPPIQFALDRLAPLLQPSASVDPKICKKDREFPCVFSRNDELTLSDAHLENCTVGTNTKDGRALVELSPADAHRAGMWMLSFAASQGIDVRLPAVQWRGAMDMAAPDPPIPAECPTCAKVKEAIGLRDE